MGRRLSNGELGEITMTALTQDERGRWVVDKEPPRQGDRVPMWRARASYRDRFGKSGDLSARVVGHRRKIEAANDAEAKIEAKFRQKVSTHNGVRIMDNSARFSEWGEAWLAWLRSPSCRLAHSSKALYERCYSHHVTNSSLADLTLEQANDVQLLTALLQGIADSHGTGTAKATRSVLAGILNMAVRKNALPHSALRNVAPIAGASRARRKNGHTRNTDRALTPQERSHVITTADRYAARAELWNRSRIKWEATADLIAVMAATGMRISEARTLAWADIDTKAGTIHVRGTKTENSMRWVAMPPVLATRLEERKERQQRDEINSPHVFPAPGNPANVWDRSNAANAVRTVMDEAGLKQYTPHVFRRTAATLMHEAGEGVHKVADVLGHKDAAMTARVYLGRSKEANHRAAEALGW